MAVPAGTIPLPGGLTPLATRLPTPTEELYAAGSIWPLGGIWHMVTRSGDPGAYVYAWRAMGGLPEGYPASAAALQELMLQAVYYRHLFLVRPMRVAWRNGEGRTAPAFVPFTLAEMTGAMSAAGMTSGVDWTPATAGWAQVAVWIKGDPGAIALTWALNVSNWENTQWAYPSLDRWDARAFAIGGEDGMLYERTAGLVIRSSASGISTNTARALMAPPAPS